MHVAGALPVQLDGIHHVGVVVRDLDAAIERYTTTFGATLELRKQLPEQHVEAASLLTGDQVVELIVPTDDDSGVARFLAQRGEGLHHVAFAVDDIRATLQALHDADVPLLDREPRTGLHDHPVAFVHPKAAFGVLVELVELSTGH